MKIYTMIEKMEIFKNRAEKIMEQEWIDYNQEWNKIYTILWVNSYNFSLK